GIAASIPKMLTKRSHVLPLPEGEGGVRGKGLPGRLRFSFQPLAQVSIPAANSFRRGNSLVRLKCPPVGKWFDGRFHKMLTCQFRPSQRCSRFQKQAKVIAEPPGQSAVGKSANQRFNPLSCVVSVWLVRAQSSVDQTMVASAARMSRKIFPRDIRRKR